MPVLVVGGETTLAALDRRLFEAGVSTDAARVILTVAANG